MYAHELLTYDPPMKDYINGSQAVAFNSADPLDVDDIIAQPQRSDGLVKGEEDGLVTTGDSSYNRWALLNINFPYLQDIANFILGEHLKLIP